MPLSKIVAQPAYPSSSSLAVAACPYRAEKRCPRCADTALMLRDPQVEVRLPYVRDEVTLRAGPPLDVSHLDLQRPSFSICLKVRYNVPGLIPSNPKAAVRSMSSYP